jgi:hypothetical protein
MPIIAIDTVPLGFCETGAGRPGTGVDAEPPVMPALANELATNAVVASEMVAATTDCLRDAAIRHTLFP